MPLSMTPGSSIIASPDFDADIAFAEISTARHSQSSRNPFHAGQVFRGFPIHAFATACQVARPPCTDQTDTTRPSEVFTSRLSTDRLPSPLLDMTTTATGLLCWRNSHPLECQLASLHQTRTCSFPAYGSHLGYPRRCCAVCRPAPGARVPGTVPGACCAGLPFPSASALGSTGSAAVCSIADCSATVCSTLFVGFTATMAELDFSCPCIIGYDSSSSRCGPSLALDADGQSRDLPASDAILLRVMWPSTPAGRQHLA